MRERRGQPSEERLGRVVTSIDKCAARTIADLDSVTPGSRSVILPNDSVRRTGPASESNRAACLVELKVGTSRLVVASYAAVGISCGSGWEAALCVRFDDIDNFAVDLADAVRAGGVDSRVTLGPKYMLVTKLPCTSLEGVRLTE
jgi:hypothetical protein